MFRKLLDAQSETIVVDDKVLSIDETIRFYCVKQCDHPG
jgi:hypothetical protein